MVSAMDRFKQGDPEQTSSRWNAVVFAVVMLIIGMLPGSIAFMLDPSTPTRIGLGEIPIPAPVFVMVWLIAYPCMGVATWLIWRRRDTINVSVPIAIFIVGFLNTFIFWFTNSVYMTAVIDFVVLSLAYTVAFVYFQYDKRTLLWLLPWLIWMPITFGVKVLTVLGSVG